MGRIQTETRKLVTGPSRKTTNNQATIGVSFPLTCLNWDFNTIEDKGRLLAYHQALLAGLKVAVGQPANLTLGYGISQGDNERPEAFL